MTHETSQVTYNQSVSIIIFNAYTITSKWTEVQLPRCKHQTNSNRFQVLFSATVRRKGHKNFR